MIGTGEYTTGFVGGAASASDKKVGVVGLTMFDLRRRGKVGRLGMVGVDGSKFPAIRSHLDSNISRVYNNLDSSFDSFPSDTERDANAYKKAIDTLQPGDAITIFTPDPTHLPIALYAVDRGVHVLVTKPAVQKLDEHQELLRRARKNKVFVFVEHHKRFDPVYADARARARTLGDFSYFYAYMAQPRYQLDTFRAWAGAQSDISYYLNSHHVDVCDSMVRPMGYRPVLVSASSAAGVATGTKGCVPGTEDVISLSVTWARRGQKTDEQEEMETKQSRAVGVFTASWTAPERAGVHTSQYFHYLASRGEIRVDQSRRGYDVVDDEGAAQTTWPNPFYMRYAPGDDGHFAGQTGYGYLSLERFVDACRSVNAGAVVPHELDSRLELPTLANTVATTAVLEAGPTTTINHHPKMASSPRPEAARRKTPLHNRLTSIARDAAFVADACALLSLPMIANERCGSWYVRPGCGSASAYFKSTDGHERAWKFSLRRLNLHLVGIAEGNDGFVIVDSTRRGKRMPDALSVTVPIWCSVINQVLLPHNPLSQTVFLPPHLPPTIKSQIRALVPTFVDNLLSLRLKLGPHRLSKPLRPFWIGNGSVLPEGGVPIFELYRPVVCCTASRYLADDRHGEEGDDEEEDEGYVQGAADDAENWALGLTPSIFWHHVNDLLAANEEDLPPLIKRLPTPREGWVKSSTQMEVGLGRHKTASRNLRLALPDVCAFVDGFLTASADGAQVVVVCESGSDLSVGTALALSCRVFSDAAETQTLTKPVVKARLAAIMTAFPEANPSRQTLQSVNSFLLDWRRDGLPKRAVQEEEEEEEEEDKALI
ncbi:hypothetical protein L249_2009 [Ophiocordyceps polyrhachis-furcata BCC 54312]|uniref:Gfo/Idh/MocA-like oxidoreductase N-terminal domain-containing protein n=1 Tax=Ophiocordyceps polyrhachis-furcata BCC 54312 TaxID=1330021 RepID=A0A367LQ93_9HYPO|nr:hypothetical protein L249_2009 [Ophiocordyceps polyrhachis-furcata BCC 54312]